MSKIQTAERVSGSDVSDNYVFQRSLLAYVEAAKLISGKVLEIGTGSGYGIEIISPVADEFVTVDKFETSALEKIKGHDNVKFIQMSIPPLVGLEDNSFDFAISFQVIEHIKKDHDFIKEIHRVLKPGGKFIVTTPNKTMSISRNPWHIREYKIEELTSMLGKYYSSVDSKGVFGNETVMKYYEQNKTSVNKTMRFDIFNFQWWGPRWMLQVPYDYLNRRNRNKLTDAGAHIQLEDYFIDDAKEGCFDLFYVATK
ncbi:MAG: class I SAM-dependent methyltransferase [Crocinitomicaceae bacterium]|jgi:ubiquinone/menaquinone biosynthesis C-methylase UbiE|nr:class I SAM-dependent methyltransferase [Crocinitomicaceae bacterium]MDC0099218.1 class I SAM-dependent methyltransferase [Crocinitomicaceae bacterium]|tara:strand:- start:122 stop:886 length:765 start_codon:yes stop_codon:yes gene_type:complete